MLRSAIKFSESFFKKPNHIHPIRNVFPLILDLRNSSTSSLIAFEDCLSTLGLSDKQVADLLLVHPEIVSNGTSNLQKTIDSLMRCQFGKDQLNTLILRHPYILCVDCNTIEHTFLNLIKSYKKSTTFKMLINSPNILNEQWSAVEKKIRYLESAMLASISEIAEFGALNYSLDYIKQRHTFLQKVGVYKDLSPKMKSHDRQKINPGLDRVLNSSDDVFVRKIAGVSLWEFEVYKQLFISDEEDN